MALFRRRSTSDEEPSADLIAAADPSTEQEQVVEDEPTGAVGGSDRSEGPFDETEADRADQSLPRLDLGSLLIPGLPGIGVQVEADPNTQEVRAVTGVGQEAAVQLQAFAAPRSEGIWEDIRAEMLAEISATDGARVTEHEGPFGPELRAVIPARSPEGKQVLQPLRFTGIDGPRWFIRAVFLGRAAVEPDPQDALHTLVRDCPRIRPRAWRLGTRQMPRTWRSRSTRWRTRARADPGTPTSTRSSVALRSPRSADGSRRPDTRVRLRCEHHR
jgi:hypothetical protein